ncbi:MAG: hypothetical protein D6725_02570 [Planctomycetota bacterium]|nr:MAG: hypothetical protein D6725_02570 [Planctomycetota bacterium]
MSVAILLTATCGCPRNDAPPGGSGNGTEAAPNGLPQTVRQASSVRGISHDVQKPPLADDVPTANGGGRGTADTGRHDKSVAETGTSESAASAGSERPPHPAALAARQLLRSWTHGRPSDVFRLLPSPWQRDLETLIHRAGRDLDPRVLGQLRRFFTLAARLWNERRNDILTAPAVRHTPVASWPPAAHQHLGRLLTLLAESDLWDPERLARLNLAAYLHDEGDALATALLQFLRAVPEAAPRLQGVENCTIRATALDGGLARVQLELPNRPPIETVYVRIDGKWVPQGLAEQWPKWMARVSEWLTARRAGRSQPAELQGQPGVNRAGAQESTTGASTPHTPHPSDERTRGPAEGLRRLNDELELLLHSESGRVFQERLSALMQRWKHLSGTASPAQFPPETEEILGPPPAAKANGQ